MLTRPENPRGGFLDQLAQAWAWLREKVEHAFIELIRVFNAGKKPGDVLDDAVNAARGAAAKNKAVLNFLNAIGYYIIGGLMLFIHFVEFVNSIYQTRKLWKNQKAKERTARLIFGFLTMMVSGAGVGLSITYIINIAQGGLAAVSAVVMALCPVILPALVFGINVLAAIRKRHMLRYERGEEIKTGTDYDIEIKINTAKKIAAYVKYKNAYKARIKAEKKFRVSKVEVFAAGIITVGIALTTVAIFGATTVATFGWAPLIVIVIGVAIATITKVSEYFDHKYKLGWYERGFAEQPLNNRQRFAAMQLQFDKDFENAIFSNYRWYGKLYNFGSNVIRRIFLKEPLRVEQRIERDYEIVLAKYNEKLKSISVQPQEESIKHYLEQERNVTCENVLFMKGVRDILIANHYAWYKRCFRGEVTTSNVNAHVGQELSRVFNEHKESLNHLIKEKEYKKNFEAFFNKNLKPMLEKYNVPKDVYDFLDTTSWSSSEEVVEHRPRSNSLPSIYRTLNITPSHKSNTIETKSGQDNEVVTLTSGHRMTMSSRQESFVSESGRRMSV